MSPFIEKHTFFLPFISSVIGIYAGVLLKNPFLIVLVFSLISLIFSFLRGWLFLISLISLTFALRVFFAERISDRGKIFFGEVVSMSQGALLVSYKYAKAEIKDDWSSSEGYLRVRVRHGAYGADSHHNGNSDDDFKKDRFLIYDKVIVWCSRVYRISAGFRVCNPYFVKKVEDGGVLQRIREKGRDVLRNFSLFQDEVAMLDSMIFGARENIKKEIYFDFSKFGIAHILAISGFHFTVVAFLGYIFGEAISLFIFTLLRGSRAFVKLKFPQPYIIKLFFAIFFQVVFLFVSGFSRSALRAFIMNTVFSATLLAGRPSAPLNSLFSAGFFILLISPFDLFNLSFLFSFSAVLYLILFANFSGGKLFGIATASVFSSLGTLPFSLERGIPFSLISPVANIILLPPLSLSIALGIIGVIAGVLFLPLSALPVSLASLSLKFASLLMEVFSLLAELLTVNPRVDFPAPILFIGGTLILLILRGMLGEKSFLAFSFLLFLSLPLVLHIVSRERTYMSGDFIVREIRELKGVRLILIPFRRVDKDALYRFISRRRDVICVSVCGLDQALPEDVRRCEEIERSRKRKEADCNFDLKAIR